MNSAEYANLAAIEEHHWYYAGKRLVVRHWLGRAGLARPEQVLLDCGAGTGRFASELASTCRVIVLDDHEESLRLLRARFAPEQIISLSGHNIPLPNESVDFITALDVLEHVPDDRAVVAGFQRLLRSGGHAVVTVPASMALWSDWDDALQHYRRYSRPQLCALFDPSAWEIVHVNYTNTLVYPVVWLLRRWRRWFHRPMVRRAEDTVPARPVNAILKWLFVKLAKSRIQMPLGVSLILIARRRDQISPKSAA